MNKKIIDMIEEYREEKDFFGEVSEECIRDAETSLNLQFPKGYCEYVKNFGSGGICGVEILGVEGNLGASVVKTTERYRKLGLNNDMVVIYDGGEFFMCMLGITDDERVFCGDRSGKEPLMHYNSFEEYLLDVFQEGIDNL
jgi:antitoxin YobK